MNQRYLSGAMKTGCRAIVDCLNSAGIAAQDVDFLAACTCTGYLCPDVGSRLIGHTGFKNDVQRAAITGLGCAGALPAMQRATDFVWANPGRQALMWNIQLPRSSTMSSGIVKVDNLWIVAIASLFFSSRKAAALHST